jgi:hypothetical protein
MKKLISIWFLLFFVVTGDAQVNKKTKWSELNQDQLNLALKHSIKTIKTGKILTFVGLGVASIDMALAFAGGFGKSNGNSSQYTGSLVPAGIITMYVGITVWIVGATKKKNISLELVKFNPTGSASINGAGLKIRF